MAAEFDSSSKDREPKQGGTGYETYGWAGLRWYTYDLGCGNDLVRAPDAVADTTLGNTFLAIGKGFAAAAFWLDDQTKTGAAAEEAGIAPAMVQFDQIVASISNGMLGVYGTWLGVALMVVATIIIWNALKSNAAAVTRTVAIAGAAMAIGALFVGAPQKAIQAADDTFGSIITDTQGQMLSVSGNTGDPRNVLIDKIFLDDWRKGWFGTNFNDQELQLGPKLRDTLAFSYAEQREVAGDNEAASKLAEEKAAKFDDEIIDKLDGLNLSYGQFQGKDSGRTGTGFMAMIKLAMPCILWIGASILKLTALLAIRLAILFAPIWVPIAAAHGGTLSRVPHDRHRLHVGRGWRGHHRAVSDGAGQAVRHRQRSRRRYVAAVVHGHLDCGVLVHHASVQADDSDLHPEPGGRAQSQGSSRADVDEAEVLQGRERRCGRSRGVDGRGRCRGASEGDQTRW